MKDEKFDEDDSVFQLLEHAYDLIEDGESPMKIIRMGFFIGILEAHHQGMTPERMKTMFVIMVEKFLDGFPRHVNKVPSQIDHGEE